MSEYFPSFVRPRVAVRSHSERLQEAAARFAELTSPGRQSAGESARERSHALLLLRSGLHRGASLLLTADEYLIGSDDECDVVLGDVGVAPRHCRLTRANGDFSLYDVRTTPAQPVAPRAVRRGDSEIEAVYDIGGVLLAVVRHVSTTPTAQPRKGRSAVGLLSTALIAGLALTAIVFVAAQRLVEPRGRDVAAQVVQGSAALAAQGFTTVRFRRAARGTLEIAGLVADTAEQERLRSWLVRAGYSEAHFNVQQAAGLVEQVRQTLGAADLQIDFASGRLRIEGTTEQLSIKNRIRLLADELQSVVEIDDRVAYVDIRHRPPKPGLLPVRIRDVMIGNPSYFRTDTGARYYEGGVLPDGAEVLAIEASQIRFRLADKVVVYNLD